MPGNPGDPANPPLEGFFAWLEESRRRGNVHYDDKQRLWHVLGHAEVRAVLSDPLAFASDLGDSMPKQEDMDLFQRGNIIRKDPPQHTKLRSLASAAFTPRVINELAPRIAELTTELLDQAGGGRFDLINELAYPLPVIVIAELLGIPAADRPMFRRWGAIMFDRNIDPEQSVDEANEEFYTRFAPAVREMNSYILGHIRAKRAGPGEDLISRLIQAEVDGQRLEDEEIIGFAGTLLLAGHVTTTATVGNAVISFHQHPGACAEVRADRSLLPTAIEEVLRYCTPFSAIARRTTTEARIGDVAIPAGELIRPWIASANRDERVFADPYRFNIHRTPNPHLTFGHGFHFCLGAPLARLEARIALEIMLDRYREIAVASDAPVEYRNPWLMVSATKLPVEVREA
jgi:cytochrome P450